jgi:hypothetical protein
MAKRFIDTEIWNKAWYQELTLKEKILVKYIFEQCDCAGVWDINFRLASFIIGETVSIKDIDSINHKNILFEIFDNDKIFVIDFIKFQYGTLSENCKPHKPIIEKLKKYGLFERVSKGYSKGYAKGMDTLEEKEKEKEKEQLIEKEKEKEIKVSNPDNFFNPVIKEFHKKMKTMLNYKIRLSGAQCDKVVELNQRIPDFIDTIPTVFERLKKLQWHYDDGHIVDANIGWLLKEDNYIDVLTGKYKTKSDIISEWKPNRNRDRGNDD